MKNILFIILVVISMKCYAQATTSMSNFEAYYKVVFPRDTSNVNITNEETLSLLIGDHESVFKSTQKAIHDSLLTVVIKKADNESKGKTAIIDMSKVPKPKFKPELYRKSDYFTGYSELLKTVYEYPIEERIKWKILNETKNIQKYKCRKAVGRYKNRNYEAWFTDEIPISEGPYVFKGLPGLILEVYDTKNYYHFTLIGFKKVNKPIIPSQAQIKTEYSKFLKTRTNFLDNPIGVFESQTNFKIPQNERENVVARHRSNNNFLD